MPITVSHVEKFTPMPKVCRWHQNVENVKTPLGTDFRSGTEEWLAITLRRKGATPQSLALRCITCFECQTSLGHMQCAKEQKVFTNNRGNKSQTSDGGFGQISIRKFSAVLVPGIPKENPRRRLHKGNTKVSQHSVLFLRQFNRSLGNAMRVCRMRLHGHDDPEIKMSEHSTQGQECSHFYHVHKSAPCLFCLQEYCVLTAAPT